MTENKCAKIIRIIGFVSIIGGIIGSLILGSVFKIEVGIYYRHEEYNWYIALIGSILSFVEGIIFIGFAEIIRLLQFNLDKQRETIKAIKNLEDDFSRGIVGEAADKDLGKRQNEVNDSINDEHTYEKIISNPRNQNKNGIHQWRCDNCKKMISELPCPYCGDNFK